MVTTAVNINDKMTAEQFVYWLQGYLEIANPKTIDEATVITIKQHLAYVFSKGHLHQLEPYKFGDTLIC